MPGWFRENASWYEGYTFPEPHRVCLDDNLNRIKNDLLKP